MKKFLITLGILSAIILGLPTLADESVNNNTDIQKTIEILPTMESESFAPNRIWVGTFQIVWNEVMDNIVYGPITFVKYNSKTAKLLNKQSFKKEYISPKSYYTKYGIISPSLKSTIEEGIKDKFNETSDILNMFDWSFQPDKIFIYAMLKKDFKFLQPFDKLTEGGFGKNSNPVQYFGINDRSDKKLAKNVHVLFYNSNNDFAVKLLTKDKDIVMLYRTDDNKNFNQYFEDMNKKSKKYMGSKLFKKDDDLRVPDISLYQETSFSELEGREIRRTKFRIDKTIETVDFRMNNEGVKLKSEAAMMMTCMAMPMKTGREFLFTDKFVLFLIEKGRKTPYYAMRVDDVETLNKTGRE